MNRTIYFNYIEERLNLLSVRINRRGKLNLLDFHNHSECFYQHFCNELYEGWNLRNLNQIRPNMKAIDLIDDGNKLIVQVSATNTQSKIESSLKSRALKNNPGYTFKFISISKDADDLRKKTYINPYNIVFNPLTDIIDCTSILRYIQNLDINNQKKIYQFIKAELGEEVDVVKLDSNLATIINILSKENWDLSKEPIMINSFEIERKISFNNLKAARYIIDDYKVHYARIDKKYREFDKEGVNKSSSVLAKIRKEYLKNQKVESEDKLFFCVIDGIQEQVINSPNFTPIPIDELELCINILVVDAFIRCKIFKNPAKYNYVNS